MKFGTFLALLDHTDEDLYTLNYIKAIINENEGHIRGLWVTSSPNYHVGTIGQGLPAVVTEKIINESIEETKKSQKSSEKFFDSWCHSNDIPTIDNFAYEQAHETPKITASFIPRIGNPLESIAELGRVSDYIVSPRSKWSQSEDRQDRIHAALFESARPVILLPKETQPKKIKNIAIAWNGKSEAAHAVARAKPFLQMAENVYIYIAPSSRTQLDIGVELQFYLSQHGVASHIVSVNREGSNVGSAMLEQAKKDNIDLLVMGAWSRSRLRQLILGGLTNYMLEHANIPVMMAR